jgi:hypothetical protein
MLTCFLASLLPLLVSETSSRRSNLSLASASETTFTLQVSAFLEAVHKISRLERL